MWLVRRPEGPGCLWRSRASSSPLPVLGSDIPNKIQTIPARKSTERRTCGFAGPNASPHPPTADHRSEQTARDYRQWGCASSSRTDSATPLARNERRMRSTSTFLIGSSCSASSRLRWRVNERSPTISERLGTPSRRTRSNRVVRNQRHASTKNAGCASPMKLIVEYSALPAVSSTNAKAKAASTFVVR